MSASPCQSPTQQRALGLGASGAVWYGVVWYSVVQYSVVQYSMVWYGVVWYGVVQYSMVWYGVLGCGTAATECPSLPIQTGGGHGCHMHLVPVSWSPSPAVQYRCSVYKTAVFPRICRVLCLCRSPWISEAALCLKQGLFRVCKFNHSFRNYLHCQFGQISPSG